MINRKGIYQTFDAAGNVIADERWQAITHVDGSRQIDNETVRVGPFAEPRSDSMTVLLDKDLRLIEFTIHGLFGTRESRICVLGEARDAATLCWRFKGEVHEQRIAWREDIEIGWVTPLLSMATVWRMKLAAGESRALDCYTLDQVTFKPALLKRTYTRHADERRDTRFGPMTLQHYSIEQAGDEKRIAQFWCDDEGVLFEYKSHAGGGYVLTAANV
jgi:hypothetical protein